MYTYLQSKLYVFSGSIQLSCCPASHNNFQYLALFLFIKNRKWIMHREIRNMQELSFMWLFCSFYYLLLQVHSWVILNQFGEIVSGNLFNTLLWFNWLLFKWIPLFWSSAHFFPRTQNKNMKSWGWWGGVDLFCNGR